ncbi:MAG: Asp-tRNA(Asn)/Glu-tRNA(Gln) amidotransferase subunit GatC [Candidatus Methanoliparum thermophilum]|uniref:Aspartyl/glutamyl-tRNA(Asn/Gln) amidotransferase subunit C n=1 Tax=Methanoliparum thermophilum TaxID=2491083 RepID=A0A520KQG0_METT2|nr:Asp-tRNA(Asn)/Glu-tRNA(Gln) amidotransferase subunit GatC [Candidatus Methanoliparum sp. LAM-1]RZN63793.1 MAG: Asp-tRNA(Asn)/Glu-tRNA(Gln) amidotransferase subunit GatC [Candidatus Methanoliparum thermophilum]BDC36485.1 aspartyl/glutamyl-tRNA(Asn/Gln) amidotransferase subunit C [Candidatus Methanoliparum sp. LAM-1]
MIDKKTLEHIGKLAKIELDDKDIDEFLPQLQSILDLFDEINSVETETVEPTFHVFGLKNVFREDDVKPSLDREDVLKNVPKKEKDYVKSPKIL